ncbi:hypothetical protein HU230_0008000 [Bradyrhizobium quebecense]|uniref:Uncharacterized protein n=1 Tax=Bradyrhizobium quebecense TaxID=2748629 RepID=A0A974ABJ4_9BRAD|nr:hypothetical protein [Bradyrhizobium quebecense]UGA45969.1 hypothetical protein HU230_0008000 [Bradyrhizobium quebecense]
MPSPAPFILGVLLTTAAASVVALFVKFDESHVWDLAKMALQGAGVLVLARLTVSWAIDSFKTQKRFERDSATFSSVLSALREMSRANDILWNDVVGARQYVSTYLDAAKERWRVAKLKFEDAAAACIFLPEAISSIVFRLEDDLANKPHFDSYDEDIEHDGALVSQAIRKLEALKHLI